MHASQWIDYLAEGELKTGPSEPDQTCMSPAIWTHTGSHVPFKNSQMSRHRRRLHSSNIYLNRHWCTLCNACCGRETGRSRRSTWQGTAKAVCRIRVPCNFLLLWALQSCVLQAHCADLGITDLRLIDCRHQINRPAGTSTLAGPDDAVLTL